LFSHTFISIFFFGVLECIKSEKNRRIKIQKRASVQR
jgi:hypothetical protein